MTVTPPPPIVGVLLPLRVETKFSPPQGLAGWLLRVRVIPDVPSVDGHDPLASDVELDSVTSLWQNCSGDLSTGQGIVEWRAFCARHGAGRAAWLARTFPPVGSGGEITVNRPAQVRTDPRIADLAGLPPTIELWLARGGAAPARVATLTLDPALLRSDLPDPTSGESRWWSSYVTAVQAGLATEIDLGSRADDIDVLYAVGTGGGDPAPLFAAHRDSGELAVLALGTATNTVDGEPAADLATDPETWRALVLSGGAGDLGTAAVSSAITGQPDALAPLPGGGNYHGELNRHMVAALWPAVFGYGLKNLWSVGERAFTVGEWALDNLLPEGPIPPLRIGEQPYGVLPVTDLHSWVPATDDPAIEEQLRPSLIRLLDAWAAAAETVGTTAGADTEKLLRLLGHTPSSTDYSWRWFVPLELLHPLGWGFGKGVPHADLVKWWDQTAAPVLGFGVSPTRRYGSVGYPRDARLPLVQPNNLSAPMTLGDALSRLAQAPPRTLVSAGGLKELFGRLPNSLLFRLSLFSLVAGAAEVARGGAGQRGALLEPPYAADALATELARWVAEMDPNQLPGHVSSALWVAARDGIAQLAGFEVADLERAFTATLDTAAYRLDPWVTGIAWRRLQTLPAPVRDLGVYGWVDAPRPADQTAFAPEFLHAPSTAQALTAAVLRDRSLSDHDAARWHMDLTSDRVRLADSLAADVRMGAHLSEALGRAVERVVAAQADVERLRRTFPIRTEHAGRRVCDGSQVLERLRDDPASLGLVDAVLDELRTIADAVDVYADLLVADAVFDVVSGRTREAAPAMDAAAGLAAPPVLDVIRTQRHGRGVATFVVAALPAVPGPSTLDATTSPGRIADPSLAAYLDTAFGAATDPAWTWTVHHPDGVTISPITLSDLGLAPVDTAGISGAALARTALAASGAPADSAVTPDGEFEAHARLIRLIRLFGGQPATAADLADDGSSPDSAAIQADLLARYIDLSDVAGMVVERLQAALTGADDDRARALRAALAWGITPLEHDNPDPATLVTRARDALAARLGTAPSPADAAVLGALDLARALSELAAAEGRLPVLARHRLDQVPAKLVPDATRAFGSPGLEPDWLETVAPVRRAVARLEAYQLAQRGAGSVALSGWTNTPGDPWQTVVPPATPQGLTATRTLVAAFGPPGVLDPGTDPTRQVAVVLLDSWSETVPATEHPTSVALHVDTPGSRPPQAILLAVPPDLGTPLDTPGTVDIVIQARMLAHARAATPDLLDEYASGLPLTMLPANPPAGVLLDPA